MDNQTIIAASLGVVAICCAIYAMYRLAHAYKPPTVEVLRDAAIADAERAAFAATRLSENYSVEAAHQQLTADMLTERVATLKAERSTTLTYEQK